MVKTVIENCWLLNVQAGEAEEEDGMRHIKTFEMAL